MREAAEDASLALVKLLYYLFWKKKPLNNASVYVGFVITTAKATWNSIVVSKRTVYSF